MATEREVLLQITKNDPRGIPGLFDRHGALFREGLIRFYGAAGVDQAPLLARVMLSLAADLRDGKFDDLEETFYNWVQRATWSTFVRLRIEDAGGEHADPDVLYQLTDPINEAALAQQVRTETRAHLGDCALCTELLTKCEEAAVEVRHAGAPCPDEFAEVIAAAQKIIDSTSA